MLVQSIATGLAVQMGIFHGTLVALASMEIAWKAPARVGDTIRVIMEVAEVDSNPKSRRGTVEFQVQVIKADDTVLVESRWQTVVSRQPKSTS